ncbi:MAG: hypothetical protein Q9182_002241 [Xanthomendoza sp. 2 TL-2023]
MAKSAHATGAARPTIASASRNAQPGGLLKPPVTTPKARPLSSSAANSTKKRTGTPEKMGADAENKQLSSTERSRSTSPIKSSLKPDLTQSTPRPSSTTSVKTPSQSISPIKAVDVGTPPVRTSISNKRPAPSVTTITTTTTTTKKPALTGSVRGRQTVVVASHPVASDTPKNIRPSLGNRNSTTIQQRLREVSLVNDMLRAAKGEDEAEDDEVKEDHGKQMGTTLTASRSKQEEAEDIEDVSSDQHSAIGVSTRKHIDNSVAYKDMDPIELSISTELPSQSPKSTIEARLTDTVGLLTQRLQNLEVSHENKISELRQLFEAKANIEGKYLELQSSNERELHHSQEIIGGLRAHLMQATQAKDDATRSSRQAVESLEAENKQAKAWEKVLEARLEQFNESRQRDAKRVESLEAENKQVKAWEKVLEARLQQSTESIEREANRHHGAIQALEQQIQEHEAARLKAVEEHNREVSALSQELDAAQRSKQSEALNQEKVRAELQDRIKFLHETNEREIHTIKCSLASEHEAVVSNLRLKLDGALAKGQAIADHQDMVENLRSQLNQLRATLGSVHASNTELRQAMTDAEQQHKKEISELDRVLEDSKAKVTYLETEVIAQGLEKISNLEDAKKTTDAALELELVIAADLRQQLEQLQVATRDLPGLGGDLTPIHRSTQSAVDRPRLRNRKPEPPPKGEMHDLPDLRSEPPTCSSWCGESGPRSNSPIQHWSTADSSVSGMRGQSDESVEAKKLGSHIQEQMIDMQEQLRQIGDMNGDILQRDQR